MEDEPFFTPVERTYLEARALLSFARAADDISPEFLADAEREYQQALAGLDRERRMTCGSLD